jgi:GT2 family glycosyltransferase
MTAPPPAQIPLPGTDYADTHESTARLSVMPDGKFFRLGRRKFLAKGVAYGPFAPNANGEPFATPEQVERDLALIRQLGANLVRIYVAPPVWFLDLALQHELRVFIDVPWNKDACFLDSSNTRREIRDSLCHQLRPAIGHKAVFAVSVVNELPADVVRWSGARPVEEFIDTLVDAVKTLHAGTLCTFGNYPPTEFLHPRLTDFVCFNVYLHRPRVFENYLARLQMLADNQPLVLGEFGMDSRREGESAKCALLGGQIETAFRQGLAGCVVYSFTDDWFKDGRPVEDWQMGLVNREREPKASYYAVQSQYRSAPAPLPSTTPRVSVVVASYNGSRTLAACLKSLTMLNYPRYEILLVDDGSTDDTHRITSSFPDVRYLHQPHQGLSVARNHGIAAARGEIIAFTDADCRADEDWLYYTVGSLLHSDCVGMGGHNFLPPDDGPVAAAVMASPGGPAHVMLTDRLAEHVPGCNMVFYKWALEEIGGFDPIYHRAGDDVDLCWRLQQKGYLIGFSPGGFVWHYRRNNIRAYLSQQQGYGEAEAMLVRRHPEYFNAFGASMWRGRIYASSNRAPTLRRPMIYHGIFGAAWFQTLYQAPPVTMLMQATTLEYHVLVTLPLVFLSAAWPMVAPLAITSLAVSLGTCLVAAAQANLPPAQERFWSRPLITILFFLQPIVRGWARYRGRLTQRTTPEAVTEWLQSLEYQASEAHREVRYLTARGVTRLAFLDAILLRLDEQHWQHKSDAGWSSYDVEIFGNRWCSVQLITASEAAGDGRYRIKCRLTTVSSLLAKLALWTMLSISVMLILVLGRDFPWMWLGLLALPAFALFLDQQQRNLRRLVGLFLDAIARKHQLVKLDDNNQPLTGWVHSSDQTAAPSAP